jgi:hypothetical protein
MNLGDERERARFLENVLEARENGYDLVCVECGGGIYDDGDLHDRGCSRDPDPDRIAREARAAL